MTDTVTNMAGGAVVGQVFRHLAESRKQQHNEKMALIDKRESSMEAASTRGGTWLRRFLIGAVVIAFLAAVFAAFFGHGVVLEHELSRNFLGIIKWDKLKYVAVDGVVILKENRTAFEAAFGFYFGQAIK
jgi:hypothetical protein